MVSSVPSSNFHAKPYGRGNAGYPNVSRTLRAQQVFYKEDFQMAETSSIKVYLLRDGVEVSTLFHFINEEHKYFELSVKEDIQLRHDVEIRFFFSDTNNNPIWYEFIKGYFLRGNEFKFYNHSFIGIIIDKENQYTYIFCGGSGAYYIPKFIEYGFGIEILERVFDQDKNKIDKVTDRQVIGDILASSRYYRRSRALAYEDDFGKYLQTINVRLDKDQIQKHFPALSNFKGDKLSKQITIIGSSSFEVSSKVNFPVFIEVLKDISRLLKIPATSVFNKSLIPIDVRNEKVKVERLNSGTIKKLISYISGKTTIDIDICSRDFESFFIANNYFLNVPEITLPPNNKRSVYKIDEVAAISSCECFREIYNDVLYSKEYRNAADKDVFLLGFFSKIEINAFDINGILLTEGKLIDYIQTEYDEDGKSYFLIDNIWYEIQNQFDDNLIAKYTRRIADKVKDYPFLPNWAADKDEDAYNEQFEHIANSLFLHKVKVNNIEICDALIVVNNVLYIIHVKDGLSATIRDLTSQAYISSRIIEEECRTTKKTNLERLYQSAVDQERIDKTKISKQQFLNQFKNNTREYVLLIRTQTYSSDQLKNGQYNSRIAKFSIFEYASFMHSDDLRFSIVKR